MWVSLHMDSSTPVVWSLTTECHFSGGPGLVPKIPRFWLDVVGLVDYLLDSYGMQLWTIDKVRNSRWPIMWFTTAQWFMKIGQKLSMKPAFKCLKAPSTCVGRLIHKVELRKAVFKVCVLEAWWFICLLYSGLMLAVTWSTHIIVKTFYWMLSNKSKCVGGENTSSCMRCISWLSQCTYNF